MFGCFLILPASKARHTLLCLLFAGLVSHPSAIGNSISTVNQAPTPAGSPPNASSVLREIVTSGRLSDLRWPDFSDYRVHLENFYEPFAYGLAWTRDRRPTPQARAIIEVLQQADSKGLNAEDYDGSRWNERLTQLGQAAAAARFDGALTVCLMRYISDLRIGKVNPQHFRFGLSVESKKYNLPQFLRDRFVNGQDIKAMLEAVEPPFAGYKRTQAMLQHYLKLSHEDDGEKLPVPPKSVEAGSYYAGIARLAHLLRLLGDFPADADMPPGDLYQGPLVDAVKRFQKRHGLAPDGHLGPQTLKQLNTPLSSRVEQLRLTLERWSWVPHEFAQPPIVVNIPEFLLRAYDNNGRAVLTMNVIVGRAYWHQTPVFEKDMRFVVFRPYWNVPRSIQRSEIVPAVERDRNYVANKNYEVITPSGQVVTSGVVNDEILQQLRTGKLAVRQKPGPTNALGLVKLMFPNEYNVYLHSTPSPQLFSQSRRDFSHGCIRVENPAELTAWTLADKPEWTLERVRTAMQSTKDNVQVNLTKSIPVLILYATAVVDENGVAHFFDDLYGHDAALEKVLARGYPYPG